MGAFDPDAWLAERRVAREKPLDLGKTTTEKPAEPAASTGFDPDAWLAGKSCEGEAAPDLLRLLKNLLSHHLLKKKFVQKTKTFSVKLLTFH
jgi:hypothetical protein